MEVEVNATQRTTYPYSCIGLIQVTFPSGTTLRGTCTLVGPNDILTATHVIYSPDDGGWASEINFYFGADYNDQIDQFEDYGYEYSPSTFTLDGWPNQTFTDSDNSMMRLSESAYDVALIGIDVAIGEELGWLAIGELTSSWGYATAVGYPTGATGMMEESVLVSENSSYWILESETESMGPGSSGGPLLIDDTVIGVKSTASWWADLAFTGEQLLSLMDENDSLLGAVEGTNGADTFTSRSGNTTVDGYGGVDSMIYTDQRYQYNLSWNSEGLLVTYSGDQDYAGTDLLLNIERVQFADCWVDLTMGEKAVQVDQDALQLLEELYVGFFNRIPEAEGLAYWIERLASGTEIATISQLFYTAGSDYGVYPENLGDRDFIATVYANVLARTGETTPTDAELDYWQGWIAQGRSQGELVVEMIDVCHDLYSDDPDYGWVAQLLDNKAEVAHYFAVTQGLSYNDAQSNIEMCEAIAKAITVDDTSLAIELIGVYDFSTESDVIRG